MNHREFDMASIQRATETAKRHQAELIEAKARSRRDFMLELILGAGLFVAILGIIGGDTLIMAAKAWF